MKKMVLGMVLTLAALGVMTSPAMAVPGSPPSAPVLSAADQAFLASLALPDPTPAAKRPIVGKTLCVAQCWDGSTVSCSGTSCSGTDSNCAVVQRGSVTCDGVKTRCPACPDCEPELEGCLATCSQCGLGSFQCAPYVCNCKACT
jgi:hypothetical protein